MADRTASGTPVVIDERQQKIRLRRLRHEINAMGVSVEKFEIDILELEATIERVHDSITATRDRIVVKEAEFAEANSQEE
jgi:predicted  nucleic acid-binding Zn-ribbon protein